MLVSGQHLFADEVWAAHGIEIKTAIVALLVGILVGITGMGGGALMTPALIFLGVGHASSVCHRRPYRRCNLQDGWRRCALAGRVPKCPARRVPHLRLSANGLPRTTPGALDQSEDQHRYVFDAMHRFRPLVSSDNLCVATLRPAATQGERSRPRRQRSHRASSAHDPSRRAWRTAGGRYLGRLWIGSVLRQHLTLGTALLMK